MTSRGKTPPPAAFETGKPGGRVRSPTRSQGSTLGLFERIRLKVARAPSGRVTPDELGRRSRAGSYLKPLSSEEKSVLLDRFKALVSEVRAQSGAALSYADSVYADLLEDSNYMLHVALVSLLDGAGLRNLRPNATLTPLSEPPSSLSPEELACFYPTANLRKQYSTTTVEAARDAWSKCEASAFNVRAGPNYRKTRLKAPAKPQPVYEVVAVDMYKSNNKLNHLSRHMSLPRTAESANDLSGDLPEFFIVNFMLPLIPPTLLTKSDDGATVCFHFVMKLSSWAKSHADHSSVMLVRKFITCSGAESEDDSFRERLKIIVQVSNPGEMGLSRIERSLYKKYNGLPFLFRGYNSKYHFGPNWFQADFDGHRSGYAARKARYALLSHSSRITANIGFLVESETNAEMPERMLGCANIHRLGCLTAMEFEKSLAPELRRDYMDDNTSDEYDDEYDSARDC